MKKDEKHILGKNIKIERIRRDLTQEEFAELISMSISHVSKIEQGITQPTALVLYKMANVLNIQMEDFFKGIELS